MKNRIHDCKCACPKCGIKGGSNTCTCGCRKCTNSSYGYRSKKEINMTNLQKHTDKVLEELNNLWGDLVDWAGSGFRYNDPNLTGEGLKVMKSKFKKLLTQALSERDEVIIKMLEGLKMEKCLESKCTDEEAHLEQLYGHNTALDKAIEIIKGEDE